jgi:hypothetical protein
MLFYGNVLKSEFRGMKMDSVCSQTDLAATLLSQLGLPYDKYNWSKNLFNPYSKHFAFFGSDAASGWIDSKNDFIFEYDKDNYFEANFRDLKDSLKSVKCGKSYLETLFQEYLDL